MELIKIIRQEHAQALSDRVVISIAACLITAGLLLLSITVNVLIKTDHFLLALLIMTPLGAGLGHHFVVTMRYFRPQWFLSEPAGKAE